MLAMLTQVAERMERHPYFSNLRARELNDALERLGRQASGHTVWEQNFAAMNSVTYCMKIRDFAITG